MMCLLVKQVGLDSDRLLVHSIRYGAPNQIITAGFPRDHYGQASDSSVTFFTEHSNVTMLRVTKTEMKGFLWFDLAGQHMRTGKMLNFTNVRKRLCVPQRIQRQRGVHVH